MITKNKKEEVTKDCINYFKKAGIVITEDEKNNIEIADFGLSRIKEIGLQLITYVNIERVCAKEMVLLPGQICPEHRHPEIDGKPGKEETFRCRWGIVYLYVPGKFTKSPKAKIPYDKKNCFTVWHEVTLLPGEQYTLYADTLHWFQAGSEGAVISEFSTKSMDKKDIFTDPKVERSTVIG